MGEDGQNVCGRAPVGGPQVGGSSVGEPGRLHVVSAVRRVVVQVGSDGDDAERVDRRVAHLEKESVCVCVCVCVYVCVRSA